MKKLLLTLLLLAICIPAFAVDFTTVNNESVTAFIDLLPKYMALTDKYSENFDSTNPEATTQQLGKDLEALFGTYGLNTQTFSELVQKITMGMAKVEMKKNGIPEEAGLMGQINITDNELSVLEANMEKLQEIFDIEPTETVEDGAVNPESVSPEYIEPETMEPDMVTPDAVKTE